MNLTQCYRGGNSDGDNGFWLGFNYDIEFIEYFKKAIPHYDRRWDSEHKLWWVSKKHDEALQKLFSNFYALIHLQGELF